MKRIIILALGLTMFLDPTADARPRHHRHRHYDRDDDRVVIRVGSPGYYRYSRPPRYVYRNWRPGRVYSWNDRRYHWRDGSWVVYIR